LESGVVTECREIRDVGDVANKSQRISHDLPDGLAVHVHPVTSETFVDAEVPDRDPTDRSAPHSLVVDLHAHVALRLLADERLNVE